MVEDERPGNKVIFTDTFKTKDLIWDAYEGFLQHYNRLDMYSNFHAADPITIAGLIRYTSYMYYEINDFLDDFEELKTDTEKLRDIFKKKRYTIQNYEFIRGFFAKFMKVSGIKNIVREKDDLGKTIRHNR